MSSVNLESVITNELDRDGEVMVSLAPIGLCPSATKLPSRSRETLSIALIQYGVVGLGIAWGWGVAQAQRPQHLEWFHQFRWTALLWPCMGIAGVLLLLADGLRFACSSLPESRHKSVSRVCVALGIGASLIMVIGLVSGDIDEDGIYFCFLSLLLVPFLLAVGSLVRARAFQGVVGLVLFLTASLAIIAYNGFQSSYSSGFFFSSHGR
jgi:hypothetical protein